MFRNRIFVFCFVQYPICTINGGQLDLVAVAHALVKIGDPLLSPHFNMVVKNGAVFVVGHGGADSGLGIVEVSLGPAECA